MENEIDTVPTIECKVNCVIVDRISDNLIVYILNVALIIDKVE